MFSDKSSHGQFLLFFNCQMHLRYSYGSGLPWTKQALLFKEKKISVNIGKYMCSTFLL